MKSKKLLLYISFILYCNESTTMNNPSWLSPHFYTNILLQAYENTINTFKQQWEINPLAQLAAKIMAFKWKTSKDWPKKYAKHAQESAQESAQLFKQALKNTTRFKNHPEEFLFGASSSSYQFEGYLDGQDDNGNYINASTAFYAKKGLPIPGQAIDFWNKYKEDIKQMKEELGITSFRLSIAWDRVEPQQGQYSEQAIDTYKDIIKTLKNYDIEPIIVLHHYTVPTWFEKLGGFAQPGKYHLFVTFAKKMYEALHEHVTYWSTFNAIEGYAFKGYFRGDGPPGNPKDQNNMETVAYVMQNMLNSHVHIYHAFKDLYQKKLQKNLTIPEPKIGIQKNIVLLDPSQANLFHFCLTIPTKICIHFGNIIQNEGFYSFLTTGQYKVWVPFKVNYSYYYRDAKGALDWIGLNIYSNMNMFLGTPQKEEDPERQTANITYRDYPEGIYRAAKEINERIAQPLNIPIIITENGIATNDDEKRTRFFRRVLYTIRKLIEEGYPIIGYTPWASHDNYEWPTQEQPEAFESRRYGFFYVNFDKNSPDYLKRTLKQGAYYYRDFLKTFFAKETAHP